MDEKNEEKLRSGQKQRRIYTVAVAGALTGFFISLLWADHKAHILGYLPFLIVLICPILHFLGPGRHGKGH
jgi:hypothetical protein